MSLADNRIEQIVDDNGGGFSLREFGAERKNLNPEAVRQLVLFRNWHGYMTLLTPEGKYREEGAHSIGAFDQILYKDWKERQPDPMTIWRLATTWPWWGVGIYFDVTAYGKKAIMIHTDICEPHQRDRPLRWLRVDGIYYYQSTRNGNFYHSETGEEKILTDEIQKWKRGT